MTGLRKISIPWKCNALQVILNFTIYEYYGIGFLPSKKKKHIIILTTSIFKMVIGTKIIENGRHPLQEIDER